MNRLDNDHHGTQMPIVSAVHTITVTFERESIKCTVTATVQV